jgi:hypothetical protein
MLSMLLTELLWGCNCCFFVATCSDALAAPGVANATCLAVAGIAALTELLLLLLVGLLAGLLLLLGQRLVLG